MKVEIIGNNYKATLSHEDIRKIVSCVHFTAIFTNTLLLERLTKVVHQKQPYIICVLVRLRSDNNRS